ncbi:RNA-directed DNA polymerase, eukaryota, reverse transcriptase zinc-binding domain protein [Tanacetum coccineum]|uniref:RNA-directed DNA polymerase, eukaryota, reverse transcriptase zinc-binding domain protein n=1 Tax=Tanacetum coccineum TaxID=301880 RepID=A0ABQ5JCD1_9ASTR
MCFADDLLMLCHGDTTSIKTIKRALEKFSKVSGLHPNMSKSTMFCGSLTEEEKSLFLSIMPFKIGRLPVSLLGTVFKLPTTVVKEIETLFKGFLWCNGELTRGKARVAWKEVCKPKDQGGLGLKPLDMWNNTLLIKHLWNIAANKESLWVKWINTVKLKGRSIWDIQCFGNDSWCWKTILSLRKLVMDHIRHKIGNGRNISAWYDRWNDNQALINHISKREVCLAGFNDQSKLCDIVNDNKWKWPDDWLVKYNFLLNILVPTLKDEPDKVLWATKQGKLVKFSTNQVWRDIRSDGNKVQWDKLVWFSQCIPRHTFILWLAIKEKLITQDKLLQWYPQNVVCCPYCKEKPDSHEHLFFQCKTVAEVWKTVKEKARIKSNATNWADIIKDMTLNKNQNNIWCIIGKLCLAATVYNVWHERNCRIFKNECRDKEVITKLIVDDVRSRLMTLKTRKSNAVNVAAKDWEVATQIDNSLYIGVLLGSWPGWTTYAEGNRVCVKDEPSWSSQYVVKGVGRTDRLWNEL